MLGPPNIGEAVVESSRKCDERWRRPVASEGRARSVGRTTTRRRLHLLLVAVIAALVLVGVVAADSSVSFSDPVGDVGRALDIKRVDVIELKGWDGDRYLGFIVDVGGPVYCTSDGDGLQIVVALDLDQNPDTGSAFYGTEVEFAPDRIGDATFLRASGWGFRGAPAPEGGIGWACGPHTMGYFADGTALGLAPNAGFNLVVATQGPSPDTAPDIRTYNYQPVPGTPPPALGGDTRRPYVLAFPSSGLRGKRATFTYWTLEGRGVTAEVIRVYRDRRLVATIRRPLHNSNPFKRSSMSWRVPRSLHGKLRFSVRSSDAAGNTSRPSWSTLVIR